MLIAGTKPGDRWYRERLLLTETAPDPDAGAYRRPDDCYDEFDGCDR